MYCEAGFIIVQLSQKQAKFLDHIMHRYILYTFLQAEQVIKHSSEMFLALSLSLSRSVEKPFRWFD